MNIHLDINEDNKQAIVFCHLYFNHLSSAFTVVDSGWTGSGS